MNQPLTVGYLAFASLLLACTPAYVGSRDCKRLADEIDDPAFQRQSCEYCQGRACPDGACAWLPCLDGKYVAEGCDEDSDCRHLPEARCGRHSAPDHICTVLGDDL